MVQAAGAVERAPGADELRGGDASKEEAGALRAFFMCDADGGTELLGARRALFPGVRALFAVRGGRANLRLRELSTSSTTQP